MTLNRSGKLIAITVIIGVLLGWLYVYDTMGGKESSISKDQLLFSVQWGLPLEPYPEDPSLRELEVRKRKPFFNGGVAAVYWTSETVSWGSGLEISTTTGKVYGTSRDYTGNSFKLHQLGQLKGDGSVDRERLLEIVFPDGTSWTYTPGSLDSPDTIKVHVPVKTEVGLIISWNKRQR